MIRAFCIATCYIFVGFTSLYAQDVRDWKLADGSSVNGELSSVEIQIRLPNGDTQSVPITALTQQDQRVVLRWIAEQKTKAKPNAGVNPNALAKPPAKAPLIPGGRKPATQKFTDFGDLKLTPPEIQRFLDDCKTDKPKLLDTLRIQLNAKASTNGASAEVIQTAKATYQFVSKDDVLIVPRDRWGNADDKIFKYDESGPSDPFGVIEVLKIVDKRTAYVSMNGSKAFVEGVDTSKMPLGKWKSYYMFKQTGTRKVPAQIGADEVNVYQAISDEGFPKDVFFW